MNKPMLTGDPTSQPRILWQCEATWTDAAWSECCNLLFLCYLGWLFGLFNPNMTKNRPKKGLKTQITNPNSQQTADWKWPQKAAKKKRPPSPQKKLRIGNPKKNEKKTANWMLAIYFWQELGPLNILAGAGTFKNLPTGTHDSSSGQAQGHLAFGQATY